MMLRLEIVNDNPSRSKEKNGGLFDIVLYTHSLVGHSTRIFDIQHLSKNIFKMFTVGKSSELFELSR